MAVVVVAVVTGVNVVVAAVTCLLLLWLIVESDLDEYAN